MKAKKIVKMIEEEIDAIGDHIYNQGLLMTRLQKFLNRIKETQREKAKEKPRDAIL